MSIARKNQRLWNRLGLWASLGCAVHCLCLPLVALAGGFVIGDSSHSVHAVMLFVVALTAITAFSGAKSPHRLVRPLALSGLCLIVAGFLLGEWFFEDSWMLETIPTIFGSLCLVVAHSLNRLKKCDKDCDQLALPRRGLGRRDQSILRWGC